jgi:MoaA/NifB/PqqE/SkfB family radical SAM enzyme
MTEQMSYPNSLTIDTINFCNARCPFCPLFRGEAQMDRNVRPATVMSQEVYRRILTQASEWPQPPSLIQQCANAETLQDPKFLDRLASLAEFGLAPITTLLTNGQFLNDRNARGILESGIAQVMIGFDGASKQVYEAHRVRCSYDRVLGNIRKFVKLRECGCPNETDYHS